MPALHCFGRAPSNWTLLSPGCEMPPLSTISTIMYLVFWQRLRTQGKLNCFGQALNSSLPIFHDMSLLHLVLPSPQPRSRFNLSNHSTQRYITSRTTHATTDSCEGSYLNKVEGPLGPNFETVAFWGCLTSSFATQALSQGTNQRRRMKSVFQELGVIVLSVQQQDRWQIPACPLHPFALYTISMTALIIIIIVIIVVIIITKTEIWLWGNPTPPLADDVSHQAHSNFKTSADKPEFTDNNYRRRLL